MATDITNLNVFINGILRQGRTTSTGQKSYVSSGNYYEFIADGKNTCEMRVADFDGAFSVGDRVVILPYIGEYTQLEQMFQTILFAGRILTKTASGIPDYWDLICSNYVVAISTSDTKDLIINDNTILQNNEINTIEFDHHDTIDNRWQEGQEILVYRPNESIAKWDGFKWGAEKWAATDDAYILTFRGRITNVEENKLVVNQVTPLNSEYLFHYTCSDFRCDLLNRLVKIDFSQQNVRNIISNIGGAYLSYKWNYTDEIESATITGGISFDYVSVYECLNQLANILGYVWYVGKGDKAFTIYLVAPSTLSRPAPIELLDAGLEFENLSIKRDFSQIANRIYCRGGYIDSTVAYRQPTTGTVTPGAGDTEISLDFKPAKGSFHLFINSVENTSVGVYGTTPADTTSNFLVDYNNNVLYTGTYNGSAGFIGTETTYMTCNKAVPLITQSDDAAYQLDLCYLTSSHKGISESLIDGQSLLGGNPANTTDNATLNYRELALRKEPVISGSFDVLDSSAKAWESGQTLHVNLNSRNYGSTAGNDFYATITKVTWYFLGGNKIKYTIEFDSAVYTLTNTLKKLVQSSSRTFTTVEKLVTI